jgi:hypothetical protein
MKADTAITITPALIDELEQEAQAKERSAAKLVEEAKACRARAEAVRLLLGLSDAEKSIEQESTAPTDDMTKAMEHIANTADKPLTRVTMKSRLLTLGFDESRMGSYFYVCIARLKRKGRISVTPEGKIWKAPTQ